MQAWKRIAYFVRYKFLFLLKSMDNDVKMVTKQLQPWLSDVIPVTPSDTATDKVLVTEVGLLSTRLLNHDQ